MAAARPNEHAATARAVNNASAQNACAGQNGCKGKSFVKTATEDECKTKGGTVVAEKM